MVQYLLLLLDFIYIEKKELFIFTKKTQKIYIINYFIKFIEQLIKIFSSDFCSTITKHYLADIMLVPLNLFSAST